MSTAPTQMQPQPAPEHHHPATEEMPEIRIYGHSSFFYWWPVWVVGYVMALITRLDGQVYDIGGSAEWFHPSQGLGVVYTLVFFLVILITNVTVRGLASVVTILAALFIIVLFAYLGWWNTILGWLPVLSVHMNLGFYILFSTLIFIVWAISVFIYDRSSYWIIKPGQITHDFVIGGSEKSYDTRGMVFEKVRQDLFRHWLLGLGSADLHITTTGAKREDLWIHNVLFADYKVHEIQRLIAVRPDQFIPPPA